MKNVKNVKKILYVNVQKFLFVLSALIFMMIPMVSFGQTSAAGDNTGKTDLGTHAGGDNTGKNNSSPIVVKISNPFRGGSDLAAIIKAILDHVIIPIGSVIVVLAIIFSGFKYVTAQGAPGELKKANDALVGVLIGTAILLGAEGISLVIQNTICHQLFTC